MAEIIIDQGRKTYDIKSPDGTIIGQISWNPSDIGLITRMEEVSDFVKKETKSAPSSLGEIRELDKAIKDKLDYALGSVVSDVLFRGSSVFSICENGNFVIENVLNALIPVIEESMEEAGNAVKQRIGRHTAKYEGSNRGLAPGQK